MTVELHKSEKMQSFLDKNYLTITQLAEQTNLQEIDILNMEKAQIIPGHTYEVRDIKTISCSGIDTALSEYPSIKTTYYYHKSLSQWVNSAKSELVSHSLSELAKKIKIQFNTELKHYLKGKKTPGCQSFDQAWSYWIDGTWGKCLREITCQCLAEKELARLKISEFMRISKDELNEEQKNQLIQAIQQYINASIDFDPYGMRHLVAKEPIIKFNLDHFHNLYLEY